MSLPPHGEYAMGSVTGPSIGLDSTGRQTNKLILRHEDPTAKSGQIGQAENRHQRFPDTRDSASGRSRAQRTIGRSGDVVGEPIPSRRSRSVSSLPAAG